MLAQTMQAASSPRTITKVPERILGAIAYVESRSGKHLTGDGGRSIGVYHMKRIAWEDIKRPGERYTSLRTNHAYARECARRYLLMYATSNDWLINVQHYNAGPGKLSASYRRRIESYLRNRQ